MNLEPSTMEYLVTPAEAIADRIDGVIATVSNSRMRHALEDAVAGGKRIRPLMACLSCAAVGGSIREAVDAGVAIELLHVSSCVHDDIMDRSPLRRGRATVHVVHGESMAILAGDALIAIAYRLMHGIRSSRSTEILCRFSDAFSDLCDGQADDLTMQAADRSSHDDHSRMVEKKTARLLEAATAIGALLGSGNAYQVHALGQYGLNVGLAYQAQDDLLDHMGEEELLGKPVGNDKKNGRRTFVTLAHPLLDAAETVAGIVRGHTEKAIASLLTLPDTPARESLQQLALALIDRQR